MYTPSITSGNVNRNNSLPLKQATIGGQVLPVAPTNQFPSSNNRIPDPAASRSSGAQNLPGSEQLPHWTGEEIDRRLAESAKLIQEWAELMNKTGMTSFSGSFCYVCFCR
jgi:hypothetical protein